MISPASRIYSWSTAQALISLNAALKRKTQLESNHSTKIEELHKNELDPLITTVEISNEHGLTILHLSDLHFGKKAYNEESLESLADKLIKDLKRISNNLPNIVIITGDIAHRAQPDEYVKADVFFKYLCKELKISLDQLIVVPGNHDINWDASKDGYRLCRRVDYKGQLEEGLYINRGFDIVEVRNEERYIERFFNFKRFKEGLSGYHFPLEYDKQFSLHYFSAQNLLILGLNSSWEIDYYYQRRAGIKQEALDNALKLINKSRAYRNCRKIAVWHHPVDMAFEHESHSDGLLEQLMDQGFRLILHGHVHKPRNDAFRYSVINNGNRLYAVCAGHFCTRDKPLSDRNLYQYNCLKIQGSTVTVHTRCKASADSDWEPAKRWLEGMSQERRSDYTVNLDW